jgi:putative hydrolase of the HAD superfamily
MSTSRFSAVLWDFGGVLVTAPFEAFSIFEAEHGLPPDTIRRINSINPDTNAWAQIERNEIDPATFDQLFAEEARSQGWVISGADILGLMAGVVRPRMVEALSCCIAAGLKVGCITNNIAMGAGAGMARTESERVAHAAILAMFDVVIESAKVGLRKPDPRIYELICTKLDVRPEACIYLDDLGINCKGAASIGMTALKVAGDDVLGPLGNLLGLKFA